MSNRIERRNFVGTLTDLTAQDRLAILSDDGSTVNIVGSNGTNVTPISAVGQFQGFETGVVQELSFRPIAGVSYTVTVNYSNTVHSSAADLDGITLFRYRLKDPPSPDFTPTLSYDGVTTNAARLFWSKVPDDLASLPGFSFAAYDLYQSLDGNYPANPTPTFHITNRAITEQALSGLSVNTRYFYKLVVRYSVGAPVVAKTPEATCNFKTARDTYTAVFSGDKRACAGGHYLDGATEKRREDAAHMADVSLKITKKDPADATKTIDAANTVFRLKLDNNSGGEAPQLVVTQNNATTYTSPIEFTSDAAGKFSFKVLSSRKTGSATVVVQERIPVTPVQNPPTYTWEDVKSTNLDFAKSESKRLFGIKDFNQKYDDDKGWEFTPTSFVTPATATPSIITCRLYLRFRKDNNDAIVEKAYFIKNGTKYTTLDANGDGTLTEAEYDARDANGKPEAPLWNSTETTPRQLWLPVNGHKLKVRISGVGTTGDDKMVASAPKSSRVASFCDATGNWAVVGARDAITYQTTRPALPDYLPVETKTIIINGQSVAGVAEFYLRGGYLVQRVNEIRFSVEDITTK